MKKNIAYWALYDFANSLVLISFLFYFSQWLVTDQGRPAWWYNAALVMASALFIITAPAITSRIDATGKKIGGLRIWTCLSFVLFCMVAVIAMGKAELDIVATVLYTLATYAYLICFLYFTPMLNDLSSEGNRSRISGIGQGANSIGQVAGLLATLPFANGTITLFGVPGRAQALLPATIAFIALALPMLFFYKEKPGSAKTLRKIGSLIGSFKGIFSHKPLALFFLAYFLFSDALITFANNFPLYLETIHHASDTMKAILTAGILTLASLGAVIFGKIADRYGNLRILQIILVIWCLIFPAMAFIPNLYALIPIFIVAGMLFGPVWGITRSLVGQLAPPDLVASSYGYYVLAERFATFVGPAVWSAALILIGENKQGYQIALISMSGLLMLGLVAIHAMEMMTKPARAKS